MRPRERRSPLARYPDRHGHAIEGLRAPGAHRGNSAAAPENTLPAFESAVELGVDAIEFDVQQTVAAEGRHALAFNQNSESSEGFTAFAEKRVAQFD